MRIWLVKDGEQLPIAKGSRKHRISNLATALATRGHQVTWWTSTHSHQTKNCFFTEDRSILLESNIELRLLHSGSYQKNLSWQRLLHHNKFGWKLYSQMRERSAPDAVVCCLPMVEAVLATFLYTRQAGIPLIVDIRDPWPDVWLSRVPSLLKVPASVALSPYYLATRIAFSQAEVLVAVSERLMSWASRAGRRAPNPHDRVLVHGVTTPEAVDLAEVPKVQAELGKLKDKVLFCFAGAFNRAYDLETVCRGAAEIVNHPNIHFVMAGDGPQHEELVRKYGDLPNLTFPGWLQKTELNALLQFSHVGLIPYKEDLVGSKAFEYMAAGLPLLVPAFGDVQQLVLQTDSGLLYQTSSPSDFARKVLLLANDPALLKQKSGRALQAFEQNFSAAMVYGKYADLLEAVTKKGPVVGPQKA